MAAASLTLKNCARERGLFSDLCLEDLGEGRFVEGQAAGGNVAEDAAGPLCTRDADAVGDAAGHEAGTRWAAGVVWSKGFELKK
jgi:hypothetical protein